MLRKSYWLALLASLSLLSFHCDNPPPKDPGPGGAVGSYAKTPTLLSLAWLSYVNSGMVASPAVLRNHARTAVDAGLTHPRVIAAIGNWTVAWGPVIYVADSTSKPDSCYTDNLMLMLKGKDPADPSKDLYVIAVAGTNFSSLFDWGKEDFAATTMARWPRAHTDGSNNFAYFSNPDTTQDSSVSQAGNFISLGVCTGLDILLNRMKDRGMSLPDYLRSVWAGSSERVELAVTGHSLGGALSPCLALSLMDNQLYWNRPQSVDVTTYPFAGQSPGNVGFAQYFHSKIPVGSFGGQYNSFDVVPHAFNANSLGLVESLYDPIDAHLAQQCIIGAVIACIQPSVDPFQYTSLYSPRDTFTYQVVYNDSAYQQALLAYPNAPTGTCAAIRYECECWECCPEVFARTENFASMVSIQHLNAYVDHYGIGTVARVVASLQEQGPVPSFFGLICEVPMFSRCLDGYCKL